MKKLKEIATETLDSCIFLKKTEFFGEETEIPLLLPSGDEKYKSFWVRDCAMMAESLLIPVDLLKIYIEIIAKYGQNGNETIFLDNGLCVPPYAIADHINYDGKAVYFPGTYSSGQNQGNGEFGFYPPFCDNYYYILMVGYYIQQSGNKDILLQRYSEVNLAQSLELAFSGYNIDKETELCISDDDKYTVDWGFVDSVKKTGKLLMASILRYNAAEMLRKIFCDDSKKSKYYKAKAEQIKKSILKTFYDEKSGWFYSATKLGKQYDVWATAYAVYSGITSDAKTLDVLKQGYDNKTAVRDGYVRHILITDDFSADTVWEKTLSGYNQYQNGGYWATPIGWYAYALYLQSGKTDILDDFLNHTEKYKKDGAPFEWINSDMTVYDGLHYGTSGILPYIGAKKIEEL